MRLRSDVIFNDQFITQLLLNPRVKFFLKIIILSMSIIVNGCDA